jgi:hypothetical protein
MVYREIKATKQRGGHDDDVYDTGYREAYLPPEDRTNYVPNDSEESFPELTDENILILRKLALSNLRESALVAGVPPKNLNNIETAVTDVLETSPDGPEASDYEIREQTHGGRGKKTVKGKKVKGKKTQKGGTDEEMLSMLVEEVGEALPPEEKEKANEIVGNFLSKMENDLLEMGMLK